MFEGIAAGRRSPLTSLAIPAVAHSAAGLAEILPSFAAATEPLFGSSVYWAHLREVCDGKVEHTKRVIEIIVVKVEVE